MLSETLEQEREYQKDIRSECDTPNDKPTDFCPNCGARMERKTNI